MGDLLTVDEMARLLDLHPKTIRRYIREERLKAVKVGGEWRIRQEDAEVFLGSSVGELRAEAADDVTAFLKGDIVDMSGPYQVCSIMDCYVDADEAVRVSQALVQMMNEPDPNRGKARFQYFYLEAEQKSRYILWGSPAFVGKMLTAVGEAVRQGG
ncbi:hypothetical protein J31TS4_02080 [Paenibacillus sp. J31TS4]|uniref:helix-turn-helix domain-containing protein n=1 Tax=Paenibacillus sp. J31TS4 TaxID=2807195 RepID=UPI001B2C9FD6|nr:helix-turn-helix domain-containing protein [Paenibacillus sp. J31TS4]GIP36928.1 hypothetical protein J31TS4_02080 [Paenibacillus sp. J31TS4]